MMCDETKLSEYFDNELSAEERRAVERHLDGCPSCRIALGSFARVRVSLGAYQAPGDFVAALQKNLMVQRQTAAQGRTVRRIAWTAAAALAATVLFVLATTLRFGTERPFSGTPPTRDVATIPGPQNTPEIPVPEPEPDVVNPPQPPDAVPYVQVELPSIDNQPSPAQSASAVTEGVPEKPKAESKPEKKPVPVPQRKTAINLLPPVQPKPKVEEPKRETPPPPPTVVEEPAPPAREMTPETVPPLVPEEPIETTRPPDRIRVASASGKDLAPLPIELPQPYFGGTPLDYFSANLEEKSYKPREPIMAPKGAVNLAKGKTVTSSNTNPRLGNLAFVTDGEKGYQNDNLLELSPGVQWVQIDLGVTSEVYAILVWHFHAADRVYFDVIVQVSDDPEFTKGVSTVYNSDIDNSSGLGVGKDNEYIETYEGRLVDAKGARGRYVRLYSQGNTTDELNHYTEVEVFGIPATQGE